MTREEAIADIKNNIKPVVGGISLDMAIEALEQQPCEDCISREAVKEYVCELIDKLPSVIPKEKTGHCKDCKWWKDSDGAYRRGIGAESKCPINCEEVYKGNGYCFMFEPQESEDKEVDK